CGRGLCRGTTRTPREAAAPLTRCDGTYARDYVYVRDIARAYMDLAAGLGRDGAMGQAFNFGNEQPLTVLELGAELKRLMDREDLQPVIQNRAVGEIHDQWLSARKA